MKYFILLLLLPHCALASPATGPAPRRQIPVLERAQALLGDRVNLLANRLDSFFANERADDELGRSLIRLRHTYQMREAHLPERRTQFRFNLKLPSLEERFKFNFERAREKEQENAAEAERQRLAEELARAGKLDTRWLFRSDAGVNVSVPPVIFVRSRLRKSTQTGEFVHRFVEELSWFSNREGLQNNMSFDTDYSISDELLFRFINNQQWRITGKEFYTSHGPTLLHRLSEYHGLSYSLIMSSVIESGTWYLSNYRASLNYRRDVYQNWLFLEVIPGLDFPKIFSFRRNPFLILSLEALFGDF